MPLPASNIAWPPIELATIHPDMDIWSAWYSGSSANLEHAYAHERRHGQRPSNRPSQYRGGLVGAVARTFWGAPRQDLREQPQRKMHVPLAGDICQASADLLFSEPPSITVEDETVNARLGELVDDGMLSTLAEAAELGAALGGTYLRTTWDTQSQPDGPFLTAVDADGAWPEFRWGRLSAVTFWYDVTPASQLNGDRRLRHLERHEIQNDRGVVLHALYEGTRENLGRPTSLDQAEATNVLAGMVTDGNMVDTLSPGLAVTYIPNQRPQRMWRHDPLGRNLGRSDLQGVEGLMDGLDETYTSWMRDVRLGKGRVFIARSMLESNGPGRGASWDADQEVFAPLDGLMPASNPQGSGLPIVAQQFAIRFAEHQATAADFVTQILRTAGYSTQTFGDGDQVTGGERTATEVKARQQRSYMTRDRKVRLWRPALAEAVGKLLAVDAAVFNGTDPAGQPVKVQFADGVQESAISLAQTAQALYAADAASTETLVGMVHPDWTDEQISDEVAKIKAEKASMAPVADPFGSPHLPPNQ